MSHLPCDGETYAGTPPWPVRAVSEPPRRPSEGRPERRRAGVTVVSLDPGSTTGYCIAYYSYESLILDIYIGQEKLTENELYDLLLEYNPHHIVAEDFEYRNRARAGLNLTPVKLLGVISLYTSAERALLHLQKASQGKAHFTNDRLKQLGLYQRGKPHGRDALRHLLTWWEFGAGYQYKREGVKLHA